MTTDETPRDPLAVALHDEWDRRTGEPSEPGVPCPDCIESAGRIRASLASPTPDGLTWAYHDEQLRRAYENGAADARARRDFASPTPDAALDVEAVAERVRGQTPHTGDAYRNDFDRAIDLMVAAVLAIVNGETE